MKVAVLGAGPAGLLAAHAADQRGVEVKVYSIYRKSLMYGAQYLHEAIPGIECGAPQLIRYSIEGDVAAYRRKVYGNRWGGDVSPAELEGDHKAWDIRLAYNSLWDKYSERIMDVLVTTDGVKNLMSAYDLVISSVPAPSLCVDSSHEFLSQKIWAAGDAPELGVYAPSVCPPNMVRCVADRNVSWYRASNIFGHSTIEWPETTHKPWPTASLVHKPLTNTCNCWDSMARIGRFGQWTKGILVHNAYHDAIDAIEAKL